MRTDVRWRQHAIHALLHPQSIAVVGASPDNPQRSFFLDNLRNGDYPGRAYGINPRYAQSDSGTYYASLEDLPEVPDVVLAAVNSTRIPGVVKQAATLGVKATVVYDGGFADIGDDGTHIQADIAAIAHDAKMGLVGPNCYGILNLVDRISLYGQPVRYPEVPGSFALISASGGIVDSIVGEPQGARWGFIATTGNEAVLSIADYALTFAHDPRCTGIAMFVETIRDPEAFFEALDVANATSKPVVVLRVGRSEASRTAAAAHTGALALPARLFDAKLRSHGAIIVDSIPELNATVALLQCGHLPAGTGVALVSGSGGHNELAVDACAGTAVELAEFADTTIDRLDGIVGPYVRKENPLDWYPSDPENLPRILSAVLDDPAIDTVVMLAHFNFHGSTGDPKFSGLGLPEAIHAQATTDKPILVVDTTAAPAALIEHGQDNGVAVIGGIEIAVRALDNVVRYAATRRLPPSPEVRSTPSSDVESVPQSGISALRLLEQYCPIATTTLVSSVADAVAVAQRIGYPIAMKIGDDAVLHKTERGGVKLGLGTAAEVERAAKDLFSAGSHELLVQKQVVGGVELICGVQHDDVLGGFLLVGLGGIWAEFLDDVAIRPLGASQQEVMDMLGELRGWPLLTGARNTPLTNLPALVDAITGIDRLGRALAGRIASLDVNPLVATSAQTFAVDAAFVPNGPVV